ncbi:MAG: right-handed parallel beta-helix repeat-containing protein [Thermoanaerobaculia bacterium]|nr:right-handed parallel beta-helix repeat-containing protein [Thermoanaerobaculia bacterium]
MVRTTARRPVFAQVSTALVFGLFFAAAAQAQASRTWVSGVGDDANPCSRTAPCKTFAGAISKTAAGGEINAIDPGGYGAVTITKSITIDGGGTFASILASGTNGIVVNAAAGDVVTLRNLSINGNGTGLNGIRFLSGAALHVENVSIFRFAQKGIDFEPTSTSRLFVRDSEISENNNAANGGAIFIKSAAAAVVLSSIEDTRLDRNAFGIRAEDGATVTVSRTAIANGNGIAIQAVGAATAAAINLDDCAVSANGANGIVANGGFATVRISNTTVTGHTTGLAVSAGGQIVSFGNNRVQGNTTNGAPTTTVPQI